MYIQAEIIVMVMMYINLSGSASHNLDSEEHVNTLVWLPLLDYPTVIYYYFFVFQIPQTFTIWSTPILRGQNLNHRQILINLFYNLYQNIYS